LARVIERRHSELKAIRVQRQAGQIAAHSCVGRTTGDGELGEVDRSIIDLCEQLAGTASRIVSEIEIARIRSHRRTNGQVQLLDLQAEELGCDVVLADYAITAGGRWCNRAGDVAVAWKQTSRHSCDAHARNRGARNREADVHRVELQNSA